MTTGIRIATGSSRRRGPFASVEDMDTGWMWVSTNFPSPT